jgi:hypothetical protein
LNFTERGFGARGAVGIPDRGNTAASQLKPGDFDWDHIFGKLGVRWLHTGGIFAAAQRNDAATGRGMREEGERTRHDCVVRLELSAELVEEHRRA